MKQIREWRLDMLNQELLKYWDKKFIDDIDLTIKWVKWVLKLKGEEDEGSHRK